MRYWNLKFVHNNYKASLKSTAFQNYAGKKNMCTLQIWQAKSYQKLMENKVACVFLSYEVLTHNDCCIITVI